MLRSMLGIKDSSLSLPVADNIIWTESTIRMLTNIFNLKVQLTSDIIAGLVKKFEENSEIFANNLQFSTLILNLINKYDIQVKNS